jgi:hypothetical protein
MTKIEEGFYSRLIAPPWLICFFDKFCLPLGFGETPDIILTLPAQGRGPRHFKITAPPIERIASPSRRLLTK